MLRRLARAVKGSGTQTAQGYLGESWTYESYGMTHLIVRLFTPGMPHHRVMRQLELLAREVMPATAAR